ncbi:hypothetical protein MGN70_007504 [Eutypa lata]|nr:hypothetical protein MGN70_007504 [Eutypa lata]
MSPSTNVIALENESKGKEKQTSANSLYNPLGTTEKEIRLLEISPCLTDDGELNLRLFTSPLSSGIEFCALSYAWGDPGQTIGAIANGQRISITWTLDAALKNIQAHILPLLRDEKTSLYIWADGVCINQEDLEEKSTQVGLMGLIFKSAVRVLSYVMHFPQDPSIGCPEDDIDSAIRAIRKITGDFVYFQDQTEPTRGQLMDPTHGFSHKVYLDFLSRHPGMFKYDTNHRYLSHNWTSIVNFANTKYWTRLWIVQEVLLRDPMDVWIFHNNEILQYKVLQEFNILTSGVHRTLFGGYELGGHDVIQLLQASTSVNYLHDKFFVLPQERYDRAREENLYEKAYSVLRRHECQDPRDSLYALNALLGLGLTPDYNKSVKEVFLDWARSLTRCNNVVINLLRHSGIGNTQDNQTNLPSWLPDFHGTSYKTSEHKTYNVRYDYFEPCNNTSGIATIQNDILCIRGANNGKLTQVIDITDRTAYNTLWSVLRHFGTQDPIDEERSGNIVCLIVSRSLDALNDRELTALEKELRSIALHSVIDWGCYNKPEKGQQDVSGRTESAGSSNPSSFYVDGNVRPDVAFRTIYFGALHKIMNEMRHQMTIPRCFFLLDSGHIGIGTAGMKTGDHICAFGNRSATVALRKTGSEWLNVGPCYVSRLSDEDSETLEINELDLREFRIR